MAVFADTGYWLALLDRRDGLHAAARKASAAVDKEDIYTTELVLVELLNAAGGKPGLRHATSLFVSHLLAGSSVKVSRLAEYPMETLVEYYRNAHDKKWSLVDCLSFLVMKRLGIHSALTYDRHFEQAGFVALLRRFEEH